MFIPPMFVPGICDVRLPAGLADGIGMFICAWGDADGVGDATGICMPGMCMCTGVGDGDAFDPLAEAGGTDPGVGEGVGFAIGSPFFTGACPWCCANALGTPATRNEAMKTIAKHLNTRSIFSP